MHPLLEEFCVFYRQIDHHKLSQLPDIYDPDIAFSDPVHRISGIEPFTRYFEQLMEQVEYCGFDIYQVDELQAQAYLHWNMTFRHPRLNGGRDVTVPGISYLKYADKITFHQDYYDLGAMLYEQVPLLGALIRRIKKNLQ